VFWHPTPQGALEICRDVDGRLSPDELADALLFADTATTVLLGGPATPETLDGADLWGTEPERRWGVHQVTGMVSMQLNTALGEAFLRLRAHACVTGLRLSEVAADVVARRLRFTPRHLRHSTVHRRKFDGAEGISRAGTEPPPLSVPDNGRQTTGTGVPARCRASAPTGFLCGPSSRPSG
jgi:hypothetical protein